MRIGSALSTNPNSLEAAEESLGRALTSLDGRNARLIRLPKPVKRQPGAGVAINVTVEPRS